MTTKIIIRKGAIWQRSSDSYRVASNCEIGLWFSNRSSREYSYQELENHFILIETDTTRWPNDKTPGINIGIAHTREEAASRLLEAARAGAQKYAQTEDKPCTIEEVLA